jgi:hypothetical protein
MIMIILNYLSLNNLIENCLKTDRQVAFKFYLL